MFLAILGLLGLAGCSSEPVPVAVAGAEESAVVVSESLARTAAMIEFDGRKAEVQKIYLQHRLIFAFTPPEGKPFELFDNNVLLIGRLEVRLNRIAPGVYRLDGDGSLNKVADGPTSALLAWNDNAAWIVPKRATFTSKR